MTEVYSIELRDGIVCVTFPRPPQVEEFYRALDEVIALERNRYRLWDFSCGLDWSTTELELIADYAKANARIPSSKIGVIAPDDLTYGLFRMHDVFREDQFAEQVVFRSRDEAIDWLQQQRLANSS